MRIRPNDGSVSAYVMPVHVGAGRLRRPVQPRGFILDLRVCR